MLVVESAQVWLDNQIQHARELADRYDPDENGLDKNEFKRFLKRLPRKLKQMTQLNEDRFDDADANQDGIVSFTELEDFMEKLYQGKKDTMVGDGRQADPRKASSQYVDAQNLPFREGPNVTGMATDALDLEQP